VRTALPLLLIPWILAAAAAREPTFSDIVYKVTPERSLTLDLYLPAGRTNTPAVVFMHGGGWRNGNPKMIPQQLLTNGTIAVASVGYRFSQEARFPAQLEDVQDALAWIRSNAHRYGIDPDRIALAGVSAGAHLAMLAGSKTDRTTGPVRAVVSYFGASDFLLRAETQPKMTDEPGSIVFELLGGPPKASPALAKEASPAWQVGPDSPPLLIFQGSADPYVLPDQATRMAEAYEAAGRPVLLQMKAGAAHDTADFEDQSSRQALRDFLREHLGIKGSGH
jgi:acetyl esterase/lipase